MHFNDRLEEYKHSKVSEKVLKLKTLLDQLDIGYKVIDNNNHTSIIMRAKEDKNVFGYYGFEAEFTFYKESGRCEVIVSE